MAENQEQTDTKRVIHIEPTDAQWRTIDSIDNNNPYVAPAGNGHLFLYYVEDDHKVELYNIAPDGDFTYESLVDGFHHGWTSFDSNDKEIEYDE